MADSEETFESAEEGEGDSAASDTVPDSPKAEQSPDKGAAVGGNVSPTAARKKKNKRQRKKKGPVEELKQTQKGKGGEDGKKKGGNQEQDRKKEPEKEVKGETTLPEPGKEKDEGTDHEEKQEEGEKKEEEKKEEDVKLGGERKEKESKEEEQDKTEEVETTEPSQEKISQIEDPSISAIVSQPDPEVMEREARVEQNTHQVLDELSEATESSSGGWLSGLGSSLISSATASVSTFTHSVGEGLTSVLEAVDDTLGVPSADKMAAAVVEEEKKAKAGEEQEGEGKEKQEEKTGEKADEAPSAATPPDADQGEVEGEEGEVEDVKPEAKSSWYSGWGITGVLSSVQEKGKVLVTGGLDALESIGKHTYEIIAEGEHGLKNVVSSAREKPVLSQVLQEAKVQAEVRAGEEAQTEASRRRQFLAQFDECQGLVQLQALEMLSSESSAQVQQLMTQRPPAEQVTARLQLSVLGKYFEVSDQELEEADGDDNPSFTKVFKDVTDILDIKSNPNRLLQIHGRVQDLAKAEVTKAKEGEEEEEGSSEKILITVHEESMQVLAELTAGAVHHLLHLGQLLLLNTGKGVTTDTQEMKAQALHKLTVSLCGEISRLSEGFTQKLVSSVDDTKERTQVITNIYVEAGNSSSYLQEGLRLLLPVLQRSTLENTEY